MCALLIVRLCEFVSVNVDSTCACVSNALVCPHFVCVTACLGVLGEPTTHSVANIAKLWRFRVSVRLNHIFVVIVESCFVAIGNTLVALQTVFLLYMTT